jgi:hypothetical protein
MTFEKLLQQSVEHTERLRASGHIVNSSGIPVGRPFNKEEVGRKFEDESNSGMMGLLMSVDQHEQDGTSTVSWEATFRSHVNNLDDYFHQMRGAYQAHKQDLTEITKRYEQVLGDLYDYAVERDKQRKASSYQP